MANELFLLSGDMIATYTTWSPSYPASGTQLTFNDVTAIGDDTSRYFLKRTQGDGEDITNGQWFELYNAVDDGTGTLVPASSPLFSGTFAVPDAYEGTGAGDEFIVFGMYYGPKYIIDFNGFTSSTYVSAVGQDTVPGGDGELQISEIEAANPDAVVCFVQDTLIKTPNGDVPIQDLNVGDMVHIHRKNPMPVLWIGKSTVTLREFNQHLAPIRIMAGALGKGTPRKDVLVSPAHRVFLSGYKVQLFLGTDEALVPASQLVNGTDIVVETKVDQVTYWHIMFDSHEVVLSHGLASESFRPGAYARNAFDQRARQELSALFPDLVSDSDNDLTASTRRVAFGYEAQVLKNR